MESRHRLKLGGQSLLLKIRPHHLLDYKLIMCGWVDGKLAFELQASLLSSGPQYSADQSLWLEDWRLPKWFSWMFYIPFFFLAISGIISLGKFTDSFGPLVSVIFEQGRVACIAVMLILGVSMAIKWTIDAIRVPLNKADNL